MGRAISRLAALPPTCALRPTRSRPNACWRPTRRGGRLGGAGGEPARTTPASPGQRGGCARAGNAPGPGHSLTNRNEAWASGIGVPGGPQQWVLAGRAARMRWRRPMSHLSPAPAWPWPGSRGPAAGRGGRRTPRGHPRVGAVLGGGAPTLMPAASAAIVRAIDAATGSHRPRRPPPRRDPESVQARTTWKSCCGPRRLTRVSFRMQSAVPGVLAVLDPVRRARAPGAIRRLSRAAALHRQPGPDLRRRRGAAASWRCSLEAAVEQNDHVLHLADHLVPGTRLATQSPWPPRTTTCSPRPSLRGRRRDAPETTNTTNSNNRPAPQYKQLSSNTHTTRSATGHVSSSNNNATPFNKSPPRLSSSAYCYHIIQFKAITHT